MANTKRLKSRTATHKGNQCQQKNTQSRQDYLVPRAERPWDGIAVIIENTTVTSVSVDHSGYFQDADNLGTVDPSLQTKDRIYYLTSKYWSILSPYSFKKPMVLETEVEGEMVRIEGEMPELNSHRYAPTQEGIMPLGHPLNARGPEILDDEGQPTGRFREYANQQWGPVYPAIFKDALKTSVTRKVRVTIPQQAVQEFRELLKRPRSERKQGRQPIHLLKESVELLARYKVPVCHQTVNTLVMIANEGKPATERSVFNAIHELGLVRKGNMDNMRVAYWGFKDQDMVDRRRIGTERVQGSGCWMAQVDARKVLAKSRRRQQTADRSWMPMVKLTTTKPRRKKSRARSTA